MQPPLDLWLIRHAQPLVDSGICYGQTDVLADSAATALAAQTLAQQLPQGLSIFCSPLQRCELLAHTLYGLRADLSFKNDIRLSEMHFGNWEMQAWAQIPRSQLDDWTADFAHYPVGQHGESTMGVVQRVLQALVDASTQAFASVRKSSDPRAMVWITHAGVIRAVGWLMETLALMEQLEPTGPAEQHHPTLYPARPLRAGEWPQDAPRFGCWQRLRVPSLPQLHRLQKALASQA